MFSVSASGLTSVGSALEADFSFEISSAIAETVLSALLPIGLLARLIMLMRSCDRSLSAAFSSFESAISVSIPFTADFDFLTFVFLSSSGISIKLPEDFLFSPSSAMSISPLSASFLSRFSSLRSLRTLALSSPASRICTAVLDAAAVISLIEMFATIRISAAVTTKLVKSAAVLPNRTTSG